MYVNMSGSPRELSESAAQISNVWSASENDRGGQTRGAQSRPSQKLSRHSISKTVKCLPASSHAAASRAFSCVTMHNRDVYSGEVDMHDLSLAGGSFLPKREEALTLRSGNDERAVID
jgi:hypothetical protein